MPYRTRSLMTSPLLSAPTLRKVGFVVGALLMWAWLYFCTNGGNF